MYCQLIYNIANSIRQACLFKEAQENVLFFFLSEDHYCPSFVLYIKVLMVSTLE